MTEDARPDAEVGRELAQARVALGLSIADVALQLKFAGRQIEALEAGRFEALPTGTFARGMVRSYARLLKLDPEPLVERIAPRVKTPDNAAVAASVQRPIPITDSSRYTNLVYAALSIAFLGVIAGVVFEWQRERSRADDMTFVPAAREPEKKSVPAAPPSAGPVASATLTPSPSESASSPAPAVPAAAAVPVPADTSAPASEPSAKLTATAGMHRITLRFERESWVDIRGRGGKLLAQGLNAAGSERTVEGHAPFSVVIGNAPHVRLSYDDKPFDLSPHVKVEVARFTLE
jgi:cytoskeleton protein RodZ